MKCVGFAQIWFHFIVDYRLAAWMGLSLDGLCGPSCKRVHCLWSAVDDSFLSFLCTNICALIRFYLCMNVCVWTVCISFFLSCKALYHLIWRCLGNTLFIHYYRNGSEVFQSLTHEELTEQLQPRVTLRGSGPGRPIGHVQLEDRLLHVPLGHDTMPLVVVQGRGRMHLQLHGSVADVEREGYDRGGCRGKAEWEREI